MKHAASDCLNPFHNCGFGKKKTFFFLLLVLFFFLGGMFLSNKQIVHKSYAIIPCPPNCGQPTPTPNPSNPKLNPCSNASCGTGDYCSGSCGVTGLPGTLYTCSTDVNGSQPDGKGTVVASKACVKSCERCIIGNDVCDDPSLCKNQNGNTPGACENNGGICLGDPNNKGICPNGGTKLPFSCNYSQSGGGVQGGICCSSQGSSNGSGGTLTVNPSALPVIGDQNTVCELLNDGSWTCDVALTNNGKSDIHLSVTTTLTNINFTDISNPLKSKQKLVVSISNLLCKDIGRITFKGGSKDATVTWDCGNILKNLPICTLSDGKSKGICVDQSQSCPGGAIPDGTATGCNSVQVCCPVLSGSIIDEVNKLVDTNPNPAILQKVEQKIVAQVSPPPGTPVIPIVLPTIFPSGNDLYVDPPSMNQTAQYKDPRLPGSSVCKPQNPNEAPNKATVWECFPELINVGTSTITVTTATADSSVSVGIGNAITIQPYDANSSNVPLADIKNLNCSTPTTITFSYTDSQGNSKQSRTKWDGNGCKIAYTNIPSKSQVLGNSIINISNTITFDSKSLNFVNHNFKLGNIPAGVYQILSHIDGFLDAQVTQPDGSSVFTINPGERITTSTTVMTPGDIAPFPHGDNIIDIQDYTAMLSCLYKAPSGFCQFADLNNDGDIDMDDLNILLSHYGSSGASFSTPQIQCVTDPSCQSGGNTIQFCSLKCSVQK